MSGSGVQVSFSCSLGSYCSPPAVQGGGARSGVGHGHRHKVELRQAPNQGQNLHFNLQFKSQGFESKEMAIREPLGKNEFNFLQGWALREGL